MINKYLYGIKLLNPLQYVNSMTFKMTLSNLKILFQPPGASFSSPRPFSSVNAPVSPPSTLPKLSPTPASTTPIAGRFSYNCCLLAKLSFIEICTVYLIFSRCFRYIILIYYSKRLIDSVSMYMLKKCYYNIPNGIKFRHMHIIKFTGIVTIYIFFCTEFF